MKHFTESDLIAFPAMAIGYAKKTFIGDGLIKWLPASLCAVFLNLQSAFTELFWIVVMLWICDFFIGFLRAWHDPETEIEWVKVYRSVVKLIVIALAAVAVNLIEGMLLHAGFDTQSKFTGAALIVIGVAESISILDNLVYFHPALANWAQTIKALLDKVKNGRDTPDS